MRNYYTELEIKEISNLFKSLYYNSRGFVKLMCGKNRKGYFYDLKSLLDENKLTAILNSRRFNLNNMYSSLGTYKTMQNARQENLLTVNSLALDVDYTLIKGQEDLKLEVALNALGNAVLDGFPMPTYIEFSRNMRLVYIFKQPFVIPQNHKKAAACRTFLKKVVQYLANELNKHNDIIHFNATPHKLTSFIRVPYSINKRSYGYYDFKEKCFITTDIEKYYVDVIYCRYEYDMPFFDETECVFKWDIQKLAESVLPDLPDWYEVWKNKSDSNKKSQKSNIIGVKGFCDKRLSELEELQRRGYDKGYRETLCYLYWITLRQFGFTDDETKIQVCRFNRQFKIPLKESRMLTECKPAPFLNSNGVKCEGWTRKFKDSTIREMLGLGSAEPDLFGGAGMSNAECCKRYYYKKINGKTKAAEIDKTMSLVRELRQSGLKWKEVAQELGISERSAQRYGERIKKADADIKLKEQEKINEEKIS